MKFYDKMHYEEESDLFCSCITANISIMLHKTIYEINTLLLRTHFKPPSSVCDNFLLRSHVEKRLRVQIFTLIPCINLYNNNIYIYIYIYIYTHTHTSTGLYFLGCQFSYFCASPSTFFWVSCQGNISSVYVDESSIFLVCFPIREQLYMFLL